MITFSDIDSLANDMQIIASSLNINKNTNYYENLVRCLLSNGITLSYIRENKCSLVMQN